MSLVRPKSSDFAVDDQIVALGVGFLVDALPVAAIIVEKNAQGDFDLKASNTMFDVLKLNVNSTNQNHDLIIDDAKIRQVTCDYIAGSPPYTFEWRREDGVNPRQIDVSIASFDSAGTQGRYLITFVDRTSEMQVRRNLHREMLSDSLTGLYNRTGFEEAVDDLVAKIKDENQSDNAIGERDDAELFAIFAIDLSRFRQVNECAGSIVGDELILTVASRLSNVIRNGDVLGRMGGNEFGIFVRLKNKTDDLDATIARISSVFDDPYALGALKVSVSAAMGIAIDKHDCANPSDNIRHAQIALKQAKTTGKIEHYSKAVLDFSRNRFTLESDLRTAIDQDALELAFQPLVDLGTEQVIGFEALARWNHPDRGPISPAEFIPIAEECGLIVPLGRWALYEAAKTLKKWDKQSSSQLCGRISVNLSAVQFVHDDVAYAVEEAVRTNGLSGDQLTLELTESVIVSDPDRARNVMEALKSLDTKLAMDDFGTGYSSLEYLQKLPIDILKIDRSFVTPMLQDRDRVAIVRAVLSLASALGMETTAEGIETKELSNTLAALGCSNGQGYYYAKPLSADDAFAFLEQARASKAITV
ncbi:putative bifunctional diguanylate cyclase/phosphodiesterase [Parasphingorhabdus sp. DH2-15]|uniref:putative bifunctional diguanylate cyclase/phosphodiesterase n=1 Tax=Parasphingorhabdus sp. DH2-15 TaxID=3444112 RepID=UPI003F6869B7